MQEQKCYLSLTRVVCALAVIMIHTNQCFKEFNTDACFLAGTFIECGLSFAVPIFIMLSGATLIDYSDRYSTKEYFKKRFTKIFIPYLFWGIFISNIYIQVIGGSATFLIYYFFNYLFSVYLCIPLFSFVNREYKEKLFTGIVIVSFLINYLIPFLCSVFNVGNPVFVNFDIGAKFIIYALVGYLISKKDISFKWRMLSYIFSLVGFVLHIGGTYWVSLKAGAIIDTFRGYTNAPCFLISVGVFVALKQIGSKIKNKKAINFLNEVSKYTFSVYLIHWYVIYFVLRQLPLNVHTVGYKLITPFFTFAISVLLIKMLHKIPFVKRVLP